MRSEDPEAKRVRAREARWGRHYPPTQENGGRYVRTEAFWSTYISGSCWTDAICTVDRTRATMYFVKEYVLW